MCYNCRFFMLCLRISGAGSVFPQMRQHHSYKSYRNLKQRIFKVFQKTALQNAI